MAFFETIDRVSRLHRFIKEAKTGKPEILADRLGISRSSLYKLIEELKSYDAPIDYSRRRETFFYTKCFDLELQCSISIIDEEKELKKVIGGCYFFSSVSIFRRKYHIFEVES